MDWWRYCFEWTRLVYFVLIGNTNNIIMSSEWLQHVAKGATHHLSNVCLNISFIPTSPLLFLKSRAGQPSRIDLRWNVLALIVFTLFPHQQYPVHSIFVNTLIIISLAHARALQNLDIFIGLYGNSRWCDDGIEFYLFSVCSASVVQEFVITNHWTIQLKLDERVKEGMHKFNLYFRMKVVEITLFWIIENSL